MDESFFKVLIRATSVALVLGLVLLVAVPRHASFLSDYVDVFAVAFCFTFLGHYIDRLLVALPDIRSGAGPVVRAAGWFAGGLWCYIIGRWLWIQFGRDLGELPGLWWGGVFLVAYELIARRRVDSPQ